MSTDRHESVASSTLTLSTPVVFRGHQPTARVVSVGINPSIREFYSRSGSELDGDNRRFETTASLGLGSVSEVTQTMGTRMRQRCLSYFEGNPYMDWFAPMELLVRGITGTSFFDGSAYHLDLVHWATDPLWGRLSTGVQRELLLRDRPAVVEQLDSPSLEIIYLNGTTVCDEVSCIVALSTRAAQFRGQGHKRRFYRGRHGKAMVIGCSSNIQEERLKTTDRADFIKWIISECRSDLGALASNP